MSDDAPIVFDIGGDEVVLGRVRKYREGRVLDRDGERIGRTIYFAEVEVTVLEDGDDPGDPTGESREYWLYPSREDAGVLLRYNKRLEIEADPDEAISLIGAKNLIQWALGRPAGPGTSKVRSLDEWLDLCRDAPWEDLASYDGEEQDVDEVESEDQEAAELMGVSNWQNLERELGFVPGVAYRTN